MALRKNVKQETEKITLLDVPIDSDLPIRMENISKQTGLSHFNLVQKWILQEESLLGFMSYRKEQTEPGTARRKTTGAEKQEVKEVKEVTAAVDPLINPKSADYRKTIARKAKKLKKEGMTLKKIAETFNEEKVSTISGTGKWYTSSITWLINSAKASK